MKSTLSLFLLYSLLIPSTCALRLRKRQDGVEPRVLSLDLHRTQMGDTTYEHAHHKRVNATANVDISNMVKSLPATSHPLNKVLT